MMEKGGSAEQSWEVWWKEENGFFKNLSVSWKALLVMQKCLLWTFVGAGLMGGRFLRDSREQQRLLALLGLFAVFFFGNWIIAKLERSFSYAVRRLISLFLSTSVGIIVIYSFATHTLFFRYSVAMYYLISSIAFLCVLMGANVTYLYKMHDYMVGHLLFIIIGVLSSLQVPI
jgi:hypothetical protein